MRLNCKENQTTKQQTKWELTCKGQTKLVAEDSNAREFVFQQRLYSEPPPSHCHQKEGHSMHVDGWVQPLGGTCAMSLIKQSFSDTCLKEGMGKEGLPGCELD